MRENSSWYPSGRLPVMCKERLILAGAARRSGLLVDAGCVAYPVAFT
jgi:hypothetical protein